MKKKIMFILCTVVILCIGSIVNAATTLTDIKNTKYEDSVNTLITLGVVNGYPEDNTYRPNNAVTRAEMAKLMVVSLGQEGKVATAAKSASKFKDVTSADWEIGYVNVAADLGIINGYPDGTFGSKNTVSYAEATTMIIRALEYEDEVNKRNEVWPTNYINQAKKLSLYTSVGTINSNDGAKRGNVAILLWNMLRTGVCTPIGQDNTGLVYGEGELLLNKKMSKFTFLEDVLVNDVDFDDSFETAEVKLVGSKTIKVDVDALDATEMYGRRFDILYNTSSKKIVQMEETSDYNVKEGEITNLTSSKIYIDGGSSNGYSLPDDDNILLYGIDDLDEAVTATLILNGSTLKYVVGYAPEKVYLALVTDTGVTVSDEEGIRVVNYKSSSSKAYALEDDDASVDIDDVILYYLNEDNELVILGKSNVFDSTEVDLANTSKIEAGTKSYTLSTTPYEIVKVKSSSLASMSASAIEEDVDSVDVISFGGKRYFIIYIGGEDEAYEQLEKDIETACSTLSTYMNKNVVKTAYNSEKSYTFATYARFANAYDDASDAITAARATASNSNLTKVKNAYTTLQSAYTSLKKITTLTTSAREEELEKIEAKIALRKIVKGEKEIDGKKAPTCVTNKSTYETASYNTFATALSSAKTILRSTTTTKTRIESATTTLSNAMTNLKTKAESEDRVTALNALEAKIAEAEDLKDNSSAYNEAAYNIFLSYLADAKAIAESSSSTKAQIEEATADLEEAITMLSESLKESSLNNLLQIAEEKLAEENTYMTETVTALQTAYKDGLDAKDQTNNYTAIANATKALEDAIDGLVNVNEELERLVARGVALDIDSIVNKNINVNNLSSYEFSIKENYIEAFTVAIADEEKDIRVYTVLLRDAIQTASTKNASNWDTSMYEATLEELEDLREAAEAVIADIDAGEVVNSKTIKTAYDNLDKALTEVK